MGFEPIVNCRCCGEPLDVYQAFEDRFCSEECQAMLFPAVELHRGHIIITADNLHQVTDTINKIMREVTPAYVSFTAPVKQADGCFVSIGTLNS